MQPQERQALHFMAFTPALAPLLILSFKPLVVASPLQLVHPSPVAQPVAYKVLVPSVDEHPDSGEQEVGNEVVGA